MGFATFFTYMGESLWRRSNGELHQTAGYDRQLRHATEISMESKSDSTQVSQHCYALQSWASEFGPPHPEPEGLHRDYLREKPHYALTQTQYFGFSIPQHNVHALLMLWHHPNLGVISGGPMVW